jgi:hypothetical protein
MGWASGAGGRRHRKRLADRDFARILYKGFNRRLLELLEDGPHGAEPDQGAIAYKKDHGHHRAPYIISISRV